MTVVNTVKLGDIAKILNGYAFKSNNYVDKGYRVVRITNVQKGYIIDKNPKFIDLKDGDLSNFILNDGDILMSLTGNVGRVGIINEKYLPAVLNQRVGKIVITSKKVIDKYLFHILNSDEIERIIISKSKGIAQKNIGSSDIENIKIPLPSIEEQKRIVKELDQADKIGKNRRKAIILLDEYLKSVFLEMFGDPISNPKKWKILPFFDLCERLSDGPFGSKLKTEHYADSGIQVIRLSNIGIGKFKGENKSFVKNNHYENELTRYTCYSGDVVIATLGEPNIRACIIPKDIEKAVHKADCIHCIPKKNLSKEYIVMLLNLPVFHHSFSNMIHGQTRSRVSSGQLRKTPIPLPPIELQNQFAEIVQKTEKLKQTMLSQSEELDTNFNALMQGAFSN